MSEKVSVHYVSVVMIPRGAVAIDGVPRTEIAKFFDAADARSHIASTLHGPGFYDPRVETRLEEVEVDA